MAPSKFKRRPSAADRWINCPGSQVIIERDGIQSTESEYAKEGTLAHHYGEKLLEIHFRGSDPEYIRALDVLKQDNSEMYEYVRNYRDYIIDLCDSMAATDTIGIEGRLSLRDDCTGGTCDFYAADSKKLVVVDLKYGAGIPVPVEDNPQLKIYAIGAIRETGFKGDHIETHIFQPRRPDENGNAGRFWTYTRKDLLDFNTFLIDHLAGFDNGRHKADDLKMGPWCRKSFCPLVVTCPAHHAALMEATALDFADVPAAFQPPSVAELTDEKIAFIFDVRKRIEDFLSEVEKEALTRAMNGRSIPGYKVVQSEGNRVIKDQAEFLKVFSGIIPGKDLYEPMKLKSPAQLEKIIGKTQIAPFTMRPPRGPVLVPLDDKRPEYRTGSDFETIEVEAEAIEEKPVEKKTAKKGAKKK